MSMTANDKERADPPPDLVVCPGCLHEQPEGANFCAKCGAPLKSLAGFGPMERIYFEGSAYRRAAFGPSSRIVLLGMWLVLGVPIGLVLATSLLSGDVGSMLGCLPFALLGGAALYRITRNYLRQKATGHGGTGPDSEGANPAAPEPPCGTENISTCDRRTSSSS